ncbi:MAG: hypothetical protein JXR58_00245 [Bacteroidales bacterium]|nr:hypothetical protein [Bacteroidales bacterium]
MKKSLLFLSVAMFVFAVITSCGGGIDSEVKALAEKKCECKKLEDDAKDKCKEELEKMEQDMEKKVKDLDEKEQDRLKDLYKETYKACKEK